MVDLASPASSGRKYSGGPARGGRGQRPLAGGAARRPETRTSFIARNPSVMWFLLALSLFTLVVTVMSEAMGVGLVSTSFVKTLGKTLCLCLVAIAMDVVWGYCGILSLGHMAFFGIGGYAIGQWLMYARTEIIVTGSLMAAPIPPTDQEIVDAIGTQIFGVVGSSEFPWLWAFADSLALQLLMVVAVPGLLALVFGWLAFRSRVTGVYLSILTQAMTLALSLYLFQNDSGLRGNNGLSGLQNIPGYETVSQAWISIVFFWGSALALGLGYVLFAWVVSGKMGSVIRGIRDNEARVRFLGYPVEGFKLFVFTLTAVVAAIAGALYYPQAGIINPAELAPIASIYLAVWVAIGGRGRLYGAAIGAAFVSLLSSWFTGGGAPPLNLGFYTILWTDWWLVLLGLSFVAVTLFAPKGIGGIFDHLAAKRTPDREGDYGPDDGARRREEGTE
jgi:urea transport system permease protein